MNLEKAAKRLHKQTGEKQNTSKTIRTAVELAANQEPELFFCNRVALRQVDTNIEAGRAMLQTIIDQCQTIGVPVSIDEIQSWYGFGRSNLMVKNTEAIREMLMSKLFDVQRIKYPGLQFSRDNVLIPDLTELMEAAGKLIYIPEVAYREVGVCWNCYQVADGKVIILPEQTELIKNQFRAYATTPEQRAKLARAKTLCRALDAFVGDKDVQPEKLNIIGLCYFDPESGRYEPSDQYIKFGLTPKFKL